MSTHIDAALEQPFVVRVPPESKDKDESLVKRIRGAAYRNFGTFSAARIPRRLSQFDRVWGALRYVKRFPKDCMTCICSFLPARNLALDTEDPVLRPDDQYLRQQMIADSAQRVFQSHMDKAEKILSSPIEPNRISDNEEKKRQDEDPLQKELQKCTAKMESETLIRAPVIDLPPLTRSRLILRSEAIAEQYAFFAEEIKARFPFYGDEQRTFQAIEGLAKAHQLLKHIQQILREKDFLELFRKFSAKELATDRIAEELFEVLGANLSDSLKAQLNKTSIKERSQELIKRMYANSDAYATVQKIADEFFLYIKIKGLTSLSLGEKQELNDHVQQLVRDGLPALAACFSDPEKPPLMFDKESLVTYYTALSAYAEKYGDQDSLLALFKRLNGVGKRLFSALPVDMRLLDKIDENNEIIMGIAKKNLSLCPALLKNEEVKVLAGRSKLRSWLPIFRRVWLVSLVLGVVVCILGFAIAQNCSKGAFDPRGNFTAAPPENHTGEVSFPDSRGKVPDATVSQVVCAPTVAGYAYVLLAAGFLFILSGIFYRKSNALQARWGN